MFFYYFIKCLTASQGHLSCGGVTVENITVNPVSQKGSFQRSGIYHPPTKHRPLWRLLGCDQYGSRKPGLKMSTAAVLYPARGRGGGGLCDLIHVEL